MRYLTSLFAFAVVLAIAQSASAARVPAAAFRGARGFNRGNAFFAQRFFAPRFIQRPVLLPRFGFGGLGLGGVYGANFGAGAYGLGGCGGANAAFFASPQVGGCGCGGAPVGGASFSQGSFFRSGVGY